MPLRAQPVPALPRLRPVDATLVEHFLDPDWVDRGALAGVLSDAAGVERVVAVAEYARALASTRLVIASVFANLKGQMRLELGARLRSSKMEGAMGTLIARRRSH